MREVKISQMDFDELCCSGKLHFVNHDVFSIHWLTFFKKIAISQEVRRVDSKEDSFEVIKLVVEK